MSESSPLITIERHILEEQQYHPEATGALTSLLYDIALAGKVIASKTTQAGLVEILGQTGTTNIQGEEVMKLDEMANRTIIALTDHTGRLAVMGSEESSDLIPIPARYPIGKYVLLFDPLDGSSNIDVSVSIGTIFSIYRRISADGPGTMEDCLQPGKVLVAAGYILYGTSTMFVYSTGHGVHGFTLDPSVGEFLLSHPNIRIPEIGQYYSANLGYYRYWSEGIRKFTNYVQGMEGDLEKSLSLRYIGSLVGDFHRNLLKGGIFYYPADKKDASKPHGKLRLLYEAIPLAFLATQAGGRATNGIQDILELQPEKLHQRTPLFIGNTDLVDKVEEYIRQYDRKEVASGVI
nr:MAG: class 1 fructose-bisphosphatase [Chloroflexota bacterium]